MLKFWNSKADRARQKAALALYAVLARQAREPRLYTALGVPDTFDGRFDALALYVALMLVRLRGASDAADGLATELSSLFVADMDRTMRETGVGDLSVGKHVKRMAAAMLGRMEAYDAALAEDGSGEALAAALVRNIWRGEAPAGDCAAALAVEVRTYWAQLAEIPLDDLLVGAMPGQDGGTENGV